MGTLKPTSKLQTSGKGGSKTLRTTRSNFRTGSQERLGFVSDRISSVMEYNANSVWFAITNRVFNFSDDVKVVGDGDRNLAGEVQEVNE